MCVKVTKSSCIVLCSPTEKKEISTTIRPAPAWYFAARTRPRAATYTPLHRQRAAGGSVSGKGETEDCGRVGMEGTTDEAGGKGLEVEAVYASRDADELFRSGGVDADAGTGVDVGERVSPVDDVSSRG